MSGRPMMFSVPAGNALVFSDPHGAILDTPVTTALSRDVTTMSTETA
ncbi:hypothetical protein [Amnibacterium kyonggiense]